MQHSAQAPEGVEEAPSSVLTPQIRKEMEDAPLRLQKRANTRVQALSNSCWMKEKLLFS